MTTCTFFVKPFQLIISNDKANEHSPMITIVPLTSKLRRHRLPTHILINKCGLIKLIPVFAKQIMSLNKTRFERKVGSIKETIYESQVDRAIKCVMKIKEIYISH